MGAGAGGVGRLLIRYRHELTIAAGAFIAVSGLVVAGVLGARIAGGRALKPALRVLIGGSLAMAITAAVGQLAHVAGV